MICDRVYDNKGGPWACALARGIPYSIILHSTRTKFRRADRARSWFMDFLQPAQLLRKLNLLICDRLDFEHIH